MSFEILLCCAIALYALLNFITLPRVTAAWNASHVASKVAKAGVLSAVQFVRDVCFVASILYLSLALLALILRFGYFGNVEFLKWAVTSASGLHESFEKVSDFVDHWFFALPVGLLLYMQWKKQKDDYSRRFHRYVDEELDRLNDERRRDPQAWNSVQADEKMTSLGEQITQTETALQSLLEKGSKDKAERRRLLRQIVALKEQRADWDYQRRINLGRLNVQEDGSERKSAWIRVLLSKGLFSDLKGFSQILSRVTLALLTVALIGIAGKAGLTEEIHDRVVHLDDLRVKARIEEAKESWEKHEKSKQQSTQIEADNEAIRQLANDFGRALARNPNWQAFRNSRRSEAVYDRAVARRAILTEVRLSDAEGHSREAFAGGLNRDETVILRSAIYTPDAPPGHPASSHIGQIVENRHGSDLKYWFGEKWANVQVAIHHHAQTYYEPVSTEDLQGELIDRIVAAAFDGTEPPNVSDVMKQARDGMGDATKEAVREAVDTEFKIFVNDLYEGKSYEESIKRVRKDDIPISKGRVEDLAVVMHERNLPDKRDFDSRVAAPSGEWKDPDSPDNPFESGPGHSPPGGNGGNSGGGGGGGVNGGGGGTHGNSEVAYKASDPIPSHSKAGSPQAESIVDSIARQTTSEGARSLHEEQVGALAEYEDHFPRSVASQSSTPLGQFLARYRAPADAAAFARVAEMDVARASSFTMLRGFSKVGGVLIGREPKGTADIRDIRWAISGRDVKIWLVGADGKASGFGPFDISLVHQSLAYSADGRPVAVTMTIAKPVTGLKIFLHPALLDTPLGCRVQELDRLVDTYAGRQLPERGTITEEYIDQIAVYNVALAKRMEAVAEKLSPESGWKPAAQQMVDDSAPEAEKGLRQAGLLSKGSIMLRKPEFFEPSLIKTMKSCHRDTLPDFESCVLEAYRTSRYVREFKKDYLRTWSYEPVSIEPWSGVRERDYQVSNSLDFLRPPQGASVADKLWPFDFMVQIAFTSPAVNLPEKEQEVYVDRQPVEFTQIQDKIEGLVEGGIRHDHFDPQFKDLRDFAVLQRLFRAALNGNLGDHFPLLKLAQLTGQTADETPHFHTRRWNSSSRSSFQYWARQAYGAREDGQSWIQDNRLKLLSCVTSVSAVYEGKDSTDVPSACNFSEYTTQASRACPDPHQNSPSCSWLKFMIYARREINEAAFGVLEDERKSPETPDCPPLAPATLLAAKR
jgi:hypothetical protein